MSSYKLIKDPLFKGLTRPMMFMGVPLVPLFIAFGFCILLATWTNVFYFAIFFIIYPLLRVATQVDEKIFQIMGLKRHLFSHKLKAAALKNHFKVNFYSSGYKKLNEKSSNNKGLIEMINLEKAIKLKELIPYSSLINESTIITKNGFL